MKSKRRQLWLKFIWLMKKSYSWNKPWLSWMSRTQQTPWKSENVTRKQCSYWNKWKKLKKCLWVKKIKVLAQWKQNNWKTRSHNLANRFINIVFKSKFWMNPPNKTCWRGNPWSRICTSTINKSEQSKSQSAPTELNSKTTKTTLN